ncbi:WYL domain-containing protein [Litoribaculum gwangyangense]|uniref:WYL domain-containing protein n=1 Tax=Litoribaculum gwangyangense TaxID=1130722 RepID=A0ABP9C089_9FLAO
MAFSKHAHYRYNILDFCFRKLALSKEELKDHLNQKLEVAYDGEQIAMRQLDNDLKVFRQKEDGFNAPLPPNIRTYKYSDPNFSIAERPLLEYERYLVDAAIRLLQRFEEHPKYNSISQALVRLQLEEEDEKGLNKIMYLDHNEEYKGIKYLKPLADAIRKKQVLKVEYRGFNTDGSWFFEFHPYLLKQYNRRWFVFGLNATNNHTEWSIPLDEERLIDYEVIQDEVAYIESKTNWDNYFREIVGIRKEKRPKERVVLKFHSKTRMHHFTTKPFHPDADTFLDEDKQDQVYFECIPNHELVQQILSYGADVEVLEPESLRLSLKEHSEKMFKFYDE